MTIEEIKKALREVRRICASAKRCTECPLSVDKYCPMYDEDGLPATYPEEWVLNWKEEKA